MPAPIRILHLSDLHFREKSRWDSDDVLTELVQEVKHLVSVGLEPDLVAITGDIAFQGVEAEYCLARSWIDGQLLPSLPNLARSNLLLIPGNHDVDRSRVGSLAKKIQATLMDGVSDAEIADHLQHEQSRGFLLGRLDAFCRFAREYMPGEFSTGPWWGLKRTIRGTTIGIAGLCSAWMSCQTEEQGKLLLSLFQLKSVFKQIRDADLSIALMHHPFEDLRDFEAARDYVHGRCLAVLRGHLHSERTFSTVSSDGACLEVAAGAAYADSSYRNAFHLIELDISSSVAKVHPWTYQNHQWIRDKNVYHREPDGIGKFQLQRAPQKMPVVAPEDRSNRATVQPQRTSLGSADIPNPLNKRIERYLGDDGRIDDAELKDLTDLAEDFSVSVEVLHQHIQQRIASRPLQQPESDLDASLERIESHAGTAEGVPTYVEDVPTEKKTNGIALREAWRDSAAVFLTRVLDIVQASGLPFDPVQVVPRDELDDGTDDCWAWWALTPFHGYTVVVRRAGSRISVSWGLYSDFGGKDEFFRRACVNLAAVPEILNRKGEITVSGRSYPNQMTEQRVEPAQLEKPEFADEVTSSLLAFMRATARSLLETRAQITEVAPEWQLAVLDFLNRTVDHVKRQKLPFPPMRQPDRRVLAGLLSRQSFTYADWPINDRIIFPIWAGNKRGSKLTLQWGLFSLKTRAPAFRQLCSSLVQAADLGDGKGALRVGGETFVLLTEGQLGLAATKRVDLGQLAGPVLVRHVGNTMLALMGCTAPRVLDAVGERDIVAPASPEALARENEYAQRRAQRLAQLRAAQAAAGVRDPQICPGCDQRSSDENYLANHFTLHTRNR